MKMEEIERLMRIIQKGSISELVWSEGDSKLVLRRGGTSPVPANSQSPVNNENSTPPPVDTQKESRAEKQDLGFHEVSSPMIGTFYSSSSPESKPYVSIGDSVTKGQVLCIVEAMKLMNEIESDVSGVVKEVCIKNETPVEFGTVLFKIAES